MDFSKLLHWSYWFSLPQALEGTKLWIWLGVFLVFVFGGIALRIVRGYKSDGLIREVLRRYANLLFWMGILGLLWLFFRQESAPLLAWRFWLIVWFVGLVYWLFRTAYYHLKRLPEIRLEKEQRVKFAQYLPQRKNK